MTVREAEAEIQKWQDTFRVLSDWDIRYEPNETYFGQCCRNGAEKLAVIYSWGNLTPQPDDYILHEMLHIAYCAANILRHVPEGCEQGEEMFVQDICKIYRECNGTKNNT